MKASRPGPGALDRVVTAAVMIVAIGCTGPMADPNPARPDYEHKVYKVSCDDGRRYAVQALETANYRVVSVDRGPSETVIGGRNEADRLNAKIAVQCMGEGVMFKPSGGTQWAADSLHFGLDRLVEAGNRIWPAPVGPVLQMDLYRGPKVKIEFPAELDPLGVVPVRVRFLNAGERPLRIDPRRIRGINDSGKEVLALSQADAERKLASVDPDIKSKLLKPMTVKQGMDVVGWIFLPAGTYQGASMGVVDDKTGEEDAYDATFATGS